MTCLTSDGYVKGETIRAEAVEDVGLARLAAMTIIAIDNAKRAIDNFREQYKIAKRGLQIAKEQQAHLENNFWPRELEFLDEFANPEQHRDGVEAIESVEVLGRRYAGRLVAAVADKFAKQMHEVKCNLSRYNASANRKVLQDLLLMRSQAISSARVMGRNIAFIEVMAREDVDWNRRMQATVIGRGLMAQAMSLISSASAGLGAAGSAALGGLNAALGQVGTSWQMYSSARNDLNGGIQMRAAGMNFGASQPSMLGVTTQAATNPFSASAASSYMQQTGLGNTASNFGSFNTMVNPVSGDMYGGSFLREQGGSYFAAPHQSGYNTDSWQMQGELGWQNLVRDGEFTYPVQGGQGGTVTVKMSDFGFGYADRYTSDHEAKAPAN